MKPLNQFSLEPIVMIVILSIAPSRSPDFNKNGTIPSFNNDVPIENQSIIAIIITEKAWKIIYHIDKHFNELINLNNINIGFGKDNLLIITGLENIYTGTWTILDSKNQEESLAELRDNFTANSPITIEEITDNWDIIEKATGYITLRDQNKGFDGTDFMVFSKN